MRGLKTTRSRTSTSIQKALDENEIDVIMGFADARMASVAAAAGYPVATVPLGFADFNGRAFGMNIIAPAGQEHNILRVMSAWETTFGPRKPPPMLEGWDARSTGVLLQFVEALVLLLRRVVQWFHVQL